MKGKKGNFEYVEKEGSMTRETTMEEQGAGKRLEFAMDAKKHVLRNSFTKSRMTREERAVEPSRPDLADILAMLGVDGGKTASGQQAAPPPMAAEDQEDDGHRDDDEDDDQETSEETDTLRLTKFSRG